MQATLPNGLRVVIVPDRLAPVVSTEINYLVGSAAAPAGFPGTAHALEHMMFRGSEGLDRDQLAAIGTRLGGNYNADTTENVTQFFYTAPVENLDVLLHIEALRMKGLTLAADDWAHERGAIEQEVSRDLSSPGYVYLARLQSILFAGTPYEHDALGTRPSFDKTDTALLRRFYRDWYAPNNAILVIAGDVDPARAMAQVRAAFGAIPARALPVRPQVQPGPVHAQTLHFPTDYPVGLVAIASRMPGQNSHDYAAARILADVLCSQRGALYELVPQGRALLSSFDFVTKADAGIGIAIAAFPKGGDAAPLQARMQDILKTLRENGVPADLVDAAKRKELAQLGFAANSIAGLAESWSEAQAIMGLQSPDDEATAFAAVTPEDVNRLARQVLDPQQSITAILTPRDGGHPVEGKGFGGSESFAAAPDHPVSLPQWANDSLMGVTAPTPSVQPAAFTLPNGLRLIVRPANVSHTVSLYGTIRQNEDMQEPPGKEGIADITDEMFRYGSTTHDRIGLQKALDDIAATESAGSDFSLSVLTPDFERGLALLAENELHPALPETAFKVVQANAAASLSGLLHSPDYLFGRAMQAAVSPKGDPSLRQAEPAGIMKLGVADCRAFYAAAYRPDLTTIVITGDITPDAAYKAIAHTFGAWRASGPTPVVDLPPRPDSGASVTRVPDPSSTQATVSLPESLGLTATNPEHFALNLGNEILGSGFSSRLYRDLRVRTGYVYTVRSHLTWKRQRAAYSISFGADPQKVDAARRAAIQDIIAMQTQPVSADELAVARAGMLRGLALQSASLDTIAAAYLHFSDLGLPLNQNDIAARAYYTMDAETIRDAFRKWIRPDDLAEIIKGPSATR
ncbi:peptidase M16 [Komagataeibacter nataicola]|uniref:Peptidase M16 n=1 Tax=Komagataeibacter nataicola TaxID=265960 RepID=A0A9N7H2L8_9PROT|nr:pitrilysin family protein [Komagataeibacter nataicola]AQU88892.1 peptidase M16 [Komagataeibacter nataicola]PYD68037.1 peptidase M16 [Komagataeibacter nataicola]WEQ57214.1 pitrilysin family protein [Komagataeibacter nataicola]